LGPTPAHLIARSVGQAFSLSKPARAVLSSRAAGYNPCVALIDTIVIARGEKRFRVRVVAAIIHEGRVLLQTFADHDDAFWVLPGGNAEVNEPAVDGLIREMKEELGEAVRVDRLLWVVDNFFRFGQADWHEIGLYWLATLPAGSPLLKLESFAGEERPGVKFTCRWHDIDCLSGVRLLPSFLAGGLAALPASPQYLVHRDG
jgi:ADP-ribose pyrophosphatase YjhB (NUDIX family)